MITYLYAAVDMFLNFFVQMCLTLDQQRSIGRLGMEGVRSIHPLYVLTMLEMHCVHMFDTSWGKRHKIGC